MRAMALFGPGVPVITMQKSKKGRSVEKFVMPSMYGVTFGKGLQIARQYNIFCNK